MKDANHSKKIDSILNEELPVGDEENLKSTSDKTIDISGKRFETINEAVEEDIKEEISKEKIDMHIDLTKKIHDKILNDEYKTYIKSNHTDFQINESLLNQRHTKEETHDFEP